MADPKPKAPRKQFLRRYTNVPSLIDILTERRLTLLHPRTWDDGNDAHFIERYRVLAKRETVLALCLSKAAETYHHWRVFSGDSAGVCVEFERKPLLDQVQQVEGVRGGHVNYKTLKEIKTDSLATTDLPFLKRRAYKPEAEYRLIYECDEIIEAKHIPIELAQIHKIVLSPWLAAPLTQPLRDLLHTIPGCFDLEIVRSEMRGNRTWMAQADRLIEDKTLKPAKPMRPRFRKRS